MYWVGLHWCAERSVKPLLNGMVGSIPTQPTKSIINKRIKFLKTIEEAIQEAADFPVGKKASLKSLEPETVKAIKDIMDILKRAGYKGKTSKQSALFHTTVTKQGAPAIEFSGWHGTGNYGSCKMLMVIFKDHEKLMDFKEDHDGFEGRDYTFKKDSEAKRYQKFLKDAVEAVRNAIK